MRQLVDMAEDVHALVARRYLLLNTIIGFFSSLKSPPAF